MREIIFIVCFGLTIIFYSKIAYSLDKNKQGVSVILSLASLIFIALTFLVLTYSLSEMNRDLEKQLDSKCPQYEKIDNVYILKK
jgi:ABC-type lipoprotein release transport system permease subunit